jgi:hypothetical protein
MCPIKSNLPDLLFTIHLVLGSSGSDLAFSEPLTFSVVSIWTFFGSPFSIDHYPSPSIHS